MFSTPISVESASGRTQLRRDGSPWRAHFAGVDNEVPISHGRRTRYVNLDNAASTPPLLAVQQSVVNFGQWYSSVQRGTGYKSRLASEAYEEARQIVHGFVGAASDQVTIFVKHTTEAINVVARKVAAGRRPRVVVTGIEHHANLLPWRHRVQTDVAPLGTDGLPDLDVLEQILRAGQDEVGLVAVSGASNVTGVIPPIHDIASLAHRYGARILVDAAQLAPHHPVNALSPDDERHLDFIAFSGHKLYAPFGVGALVAPRDFLERSDPDLLGGGAVEFVTHDDTVWARSPNRDEAGSPNVIGAVALAVAIQTLQSFGLERLLEYERRLLRAACEGLKAVPGVTIYGPAFDGRSHDAARLGLLTFNVGLLHHGFVAAALAWESGIAVREGRFCAHPYVLDLLGTSPGMVQRSRFQVEAGRKAEAPGAVRVSFAPYNTVAEVELLVEAIEALQAGEERCNYVQDTASGSFVPAEGLPSVPSIFDLS